MQCLGVCVTATHIVLIPAGSAGLWQSLAETEPPAVRTSGRARAVGRDRLAEVLGKAAAKLVPVELEQRSRSSSRPRKGANLVTSDKLGPKVPTEEPAPVVALLRTSGRAGGGRRR